MDITQLPNTPETPIVDDLAQQVATPEEYDQDVSDGTLLIMYVLPAVGAPECQGFHRKD